MRDGQNYAIVLEMLFQFNSLSKKGFFITYVHFAKSDMTLGIHCGADVCRGRTSGISVTSGSTGFASLGSSVAATRIFIIRRRTGGSQRVVARASTITGPVAAWFRAIRTAIRTGVASRCNLLQ